MQRLGTGWIAVRFRLACSASNAVQASERASGPADPADFDSDYPHRLDSRRAAGCEQEQIDLSTWDCYS